MAAVTTYARMDGNTVIELISVPAGQKVVDLYHGDLASKLVDVSSVDGIAEGWVLKSKTWSASVPASASVDALTQYAKQKQLQIVTAGSHFNVAEQGKTAVNVLADATAETMADLSALDQFGSLTPTETRVWLDNNGASTTLTGTQFSTLFMLVSAWRSASFATLADVLSQVNAKKIKTFADIDAAAWPATI